MLRLITTAVALVVPALVMAAAPRPELRFAKKGADRLDTLLARPDADTRARLVTKLIRETVDFAGFESFVLIDSADRFSKAQRMRFSRSLRRLLISRATSTVRRSEGTQPCNRPSYAYGQRGGRPVVYLRCDQPKGTAELTLWISRPQNRWRVRDMSLDGTRLSRGYRAMVNKIVRRDGVDALIAKIDAKMEED